ncbi:AAA family ATPase, partial [Vibrio parahaemolyticus]
MSIISIKISNLLSFQELDLKNINDINCFVGTNNAGKSNLFKIIQYFYSQIEGERILSPTLNSNYTSYGEIEIEFDLSRIRKIVTASRGNAQQSAFFKHIYTTMFNIEADVFGFLLKKKRQKDKSDLGEKFKLGLIVNKDGTSSWKNGNQQIRSLISYLFPFFAIDAR